MIETREHEYRDLPGDRMPNKRGLIPGKVGQIVATLPRRTRTNVFAMLPLTPACVYAFFLRGAPCRVIAALRTRSAGLRKKGSGDFFKTLKNFQSTLKDPRCEC